MRRAAPSGVRDTVWGHGPGVRPGDEGVWEWFGWDAPDELEAWSEEIRAAMPRLPADSLLFDLDAGLRTADFESLRSTDFRGVVKEFHHDVASAFRRMTSADEWIYAIDEPEAGYGRCYRFWPHPRDREHKVVRVADPGRR